jgi:DNA-binding response OmpR family regulator
MIRLLMNSFHSSDFGILIVDDDPLIRAFLKAFCEVNNYHAEFADNGTDALRLIGENSSYLLVIVDFLMPRMHGIEFIKQVKEKWRDLPVIAMSAWEDVGKSLIEAGACLFLKKPLDPYVLEREIEVIRSAAMGGNPGCP